MEDKHTLSLIDLIAEIDMTLEYFQEEFPALANEKNRQVWADPISHHCGGVSPDDLMEIRTILAATREPVSKVDAALEKAAEILANFKGEKGRAKIEEWEACYAMLFKQMNDLVNSKKDEQPVGCREAFEAYCKDVFDIDVIRHPQDGYGAFEEQWRGWNAAWYCKRESGLLDAYKAEIAALRAVHEAARALSRLMDEVPLDNAGQNDRVFAHFEFDHLRYAFTLVDVLTGAATNQIEVDSHD